MKHIPKCSTRNYKISLQKNSLWSCKDILDKLNKTWTIKEKNINWDHENFSSNNTIYTKKKKKAVKLHSVKVIN